LLVVLAMYGLPSKFAVSLLAGCFLAVNVAYASQRHAPHKPPKTEEVAPEPEPAPPLTLQEMPASPPQVSYQNGQLTIVAKNSTLGDILRAVHTQTGATVDMPGSANERVVGHLGPGSPHDILAQLLNGSHFNYVILGSAADSNKIERVVLTPKPASSSADNAPPPVNVATAPTAAAASEAPVSNQGTPDAESADDDDSSDAQSAGDQAPTQAPVRTPEQLLQELQHQQQLEQQQQQQPQSQPAPAHHD